MLTWKRQVPCTVQAAVAVFENITGQWEADKILYAETETLEQ